MGSRPVTARGVRLKDIARVELGAGPVRGSPSLGEARWPAACRAAAVLASMRYVYLNVKKRFAEIGSSLLKVEIVPVYDCSNLINAAIDTLKHTLLEECIIVCMLGVHRVPAARPQRAGLTVGVLMAFGAMKLLGSAPTSSASGALRSRFGAMVVLS